MQKLTKKQALELLEENVDNYYALQLDQYPFSCDIDFVKEAYKILLNAKASNWKPRNQEQVLKRDKDFASYYEATQLSYKLAREARERRRNKETPETKSLFYFDPILGISRER